MICRIVLVLLAAVVLTVSLDNGLGLTPQMGWNSWNKFGCNINQELIRKTADLLVRTGLADKGYKYVNLDDCWQISRNSTTKEIIEDKSKFPNGMKVLADYVHSKGLKFGLYSDAGQKTCEGRPGGYGYEKIDANTYAAWGVDYLKYDNCYNLGISGKLRYFAMYKALNESGRHIFYSMCNWGEQKSWEWAGPLANSWRTTGDIQDNWKSFTGLLDQQVGLQVYAGRGGWNDPDMLEVGNGGMTFDEYYAHFTLWAILKAPLLIGCSLENISQETLAILGNEEIIAINQDTLGIQASRIRRDVKTQGTFQVWGGPLADNKYVLVFFNRGESQADISVDLKNEIKKEFDNYSVRDVIKHTDLGIKTSNMITVKVKKHSVQAIVVKFYKASEPLQQKENHAEQANIDQNKQIVLRLKETNNDPKSENAIMMTYFKNQKEQNHKLRRHKGKKQNKFMKKIKANSQTQIKTIEELIDKAQILQAKPKTGNIKTEFNV